MYDISVFMPSIRTHKQLAWYKSLERSCKEHSFQVVVAGPFELHEEIRQLPNVKFVKTYSFPTKAAQIAAVECDGQLLYHTTDDVLFYENAIDKCIWFYKSLCRPCDIISMRYIEGKDHTNTTSYPIQYWSLQEFLNGNGAPFLSVPAEWKVNAQFLVSRDTFMLHGGFDCAYEYLTHAAACFELRIQGTGGIVYDSPIDVSNADWYKGTSVDHAPIHYAQEEHDAPIFVQLWSECAQKNELRKVEIDNYKNYPEHWERRFGTKTPLTYIELSTSR